MKRKTYTAKRMCVKVKSKTRKVTGGWSLFGKKNTPAPPPTEQPINTIPLRDLYKIIRAQYDDVIKARSECFTACTKVLCKMGPEMCSQIVEMSKTKIAYEYANLCHQQLAMAKGKTCDDKLNSDCACKLFLEKYNKLKNTYEDLQNTGNTFLEEIANIVK